MGDTVLARLAALKTTPTPELKRQWRDLFETEPPPYNRRFLESRLAYRIQELAYGGLKPETIARLEALGQQLDGGNMVLRRTRAEEKPISGTRLIREWLAPAPSDDSASSGLKRTMFRQHPMALG